MNIVGKMGLVPRGIYSNTVAYDFLDFVYYNGASYVAKKLTVGHEPHENNEYWQLLAKSGIEDVGIQFQEAEERQNIQSGEDSPTLFGKIKKWFADIKPVAFSGNVKDVAGAVATSKILTTKEQVDANTDIGNVAGATAMKEMFSEINSNLYYKAGDVIEDMYHFWTCGTLTGGNKEVWFTVPLDKPILGTPKIILTPNTFVVRQNGLYLKNIGSTDEFVASGIKIEARGHVNGTGITFVFKDSTGFGGTNNDAVAICIRYKIAFN